MAGSSMFLGQGWSFPPEFSKEHGLPGPPRALMAGGLSDIEQSVLIILTTSPGERTMEPLFGCSLQQFLFQPLDTSLETGITEAIDDALLRFEPRIKVDDVSADCGLIAEGRLTITVTYTVKATNTRHNVVYPYCRTEGTRLRLPA